MGARRNRYAKKRDGRVCDFRALLLGANKEEFSFGRIHSKTVQAKPGVDAIKSGG
jgi:hypothetical protein